MTGLLFDPADIPRVRRKRLWRMRVEDAGNLPDSTKGIRFVCPRCGHDTDWIRDTRTISENRRGLPCPCCNPGMESNDPDQGGTDEPAAV